MSIFCMLHDAQKVLVLPFNKEIWGFFDGSVVKNSPAKHEMWVQSLGGEDPQEQEMVTHSRIGA